LKEPTKTRSSSTQKAWYGGSRSRSRRGFVPLVPALELSQLDPGAEQFAPIPCVAAVHREHFRRRERVGQDGYPDTAPGEAGQQLRPAPARNEIRRDQQHVAPRRIHRFTDCAEQPRRVITRKPLLRRVRHDDHLVRREKDALRLEQRLQPWKGTELLQVGERRSSVGGAVQPPPELVETAIERPRGGDPLDRAYPVARPVALEQRDRVGLLPWNWQPLDVAPRRHRLCCLTGPLTNYWAPTDSAASLIDPAMLPAAGD
jgi:hypothetical protein